MKRIISVCLIMLALPFLVDVSKEQHTDSSAMIAVYAGRTVLGGYSCTCGDAGCIYDPGECPDHGRTASTKTTKNDSNDLSSIAAILLVLLMLGYRIGK